MIPGKKYTPDDLVRLAWRSKWIIVVPFVLATTGAIVYSSRLHDVFHAETLILATPQTVSSEYVRAAVTTQTVKDKLPTISQQILSRTQVERIIRELDLYNEARRTTPLEVIVNQMRSRIAVTIAGDGSDSFRVSYEDESPRLAMLVTERLAGGFIDESTRDRKVLAQETSGFLGSQLEDARARLVEQEKRLETYRLQYGSELPTQLQSNIQVIQNLQTQVQTLSEGINRDRDRRLLVARQLADLQSEESLAEPGATAAGSDAAGTPASVQLATALADLRALELRVTPEHPDLLRAKTLVADLQREVARQAAAASKLRADKPKPLTAAEIARHNRTSELRAEIDSLDRQVADKVAEQAELRASAQTYQARVEALPSRESDLASLTRDYDTLQSTYRILLTKKEDSKVSENLEQRQAGQQYKILDPPRLPQRPVSPNRPLMDLGAALAGLVFGIGVAVLLEFLDKSLKVEADVRTVLNLPVLATIPTMMSSAERRRAWWRTAGFSLALVVLFATCAAAVRLTFRL